MKFTELTTELKTAKSFTAREVLRGKALDLLYTSGSLSAADQCFAAFEIFSSCEPEIDADMQSYFASAESFPFVFIIIAKLIEYGYLVNLAAQECHCGSDRIKIQFSRNAYNPSAKGVTA